MLPNLNARVGETRQRNNLEAFGLPVSTFGFPAPVGRSTSSTRRV